MQSLGTVLGLRAGAESDEEPKIEWSLTKGNLRVSYEAATTFVPYPGEGSGWYLPATFRTRIDVDWLAYGVELHIVMADSRPVCRTLTIDRWRERRKLFGTKSMEQPAYRTAREETEILAGGLRRISPGELTKLAVVAALHSEPSLDGLRVHWDRRVLQDFDRLIAQEFSRPEKRGPYSLKPELLIAVAKVYRESKAADRPPVRAVEVHWPGTPRSTVAKWIRKARDAGYLEEAR